MVERNAGVPEDRRIVFRIGIHLGDVVEESDGDLMGDGVNIAARLEGIAEPGAICLSEDAYRQVKGRLDLAVTDLGPTQLKNIAEPIRAYSLQVGVPAGAKPATEPKPPEPQKRSMLAPLVAVIVALVVDRGRRLVFPRRKPLLASSRPRISPSSCCPSPTSRTIPPKIISPTASPRTSPPTSRASAAASSSRATPPSPSRARASTPRRSARNSSVRYVLEGSAQRDGTRVRVNAQLIDAQSGAHLWADRFEEDVSDLFKLQDQVVARLANSLGNELVKAEGEKGGRSQSPDAIDLVMRGWALLQLYPITRDKQ